MTFTHAVNDKSIKEPASIIMTVDDDHADTVFMESYLMPVLLLVIILAVMLGVIVYYLWIRHLFQRKELNLLREHNKLLENMPVFYAQVHVVLDKDGLLSDMHLLAGNELFKQICGFNGYLSKPINISKLNEMIVDKLNGKGVSPTSST